MKRIILLVGILASLTAAHFVFGQVNEGSILYEAKMNMHRRLPPDRESMKSMIPEYDVQKHELVFNTNESLYKPVQDEEDDEFTEEGGGVRMQIRRPMAEHYSNLQSAKRTIAQEFMGKKYLIEDSLKIMPWKFESGEKTILGYTCKAASFLNEERKQKVVAYYTDKLRPMLGPEGFGSLPGTVLMVDINDGERLITAVKVEQRHLSKNELKAPSGGQRISEKDFRKMVDEQMKKMGGPGNVIIRN